jgi:glutathione peroxidase
MNKSIYDFSAKTIKGEEFTFESLKGKAILVVNTASNCGFTPQLEGLEELHKKYGDKDLAILGFPCNQFGGQEPGDEDSIQQGCMINYGVSFQMFSKIEVNGTNEDPLYTFLKKELKGTLGNKIKWNFTKFLFDKNGNPIDRFAPTTKPEKIEGKIQDLI